MVSPSSEAAIILNKNNDVFIDTKDDMELNFCQPKTELKPFLELIDDEEVEFKVQTNKLVIDNKVKVHFDDPSVISTFSSEGPQDDIEYFVSFNLDENFINNFKKIRKIGNRFGKVYFTVSENVLYIETMDKTNTYSNGISFDLCKVKNQKDMSLCFDYNLIVNMMNVINGKYDNFEMKVAYLEEQDGGMIYCKEREDNEKYFIMSKKE